MGDYLPGAMAFIAAIGIALFAYCIHVRRSESRYGVKAFDADVGAAFGLLIVGVDLVLLVALTLAGWPA